MRAVNTGVTRVTRNPRIQFGEPTIRGSRTTVASVVLAAQAGDGVDGILEAFPHLMAEDVADAVAFYLQNRAEMDAIIERSIGDGRLRELLDGARRRIDEGRGMSHDDFWRDIGDPRPMET